jgi:methylated-DNA-[protein]-cysteine S-methyltransferase
VGIFMADLSFHSPLGPVTVTEQDGVIVSLGWGWNKETEETGVLCLARDQMGEYFDGGRADFSLPLAPRGTAFQRSVWSRMLRIPYGGTESYGDVARAVGSGARAVGTACAKNPIPILIPCHRVVGQNGSLTGYSGADGLDGKKFLLDLEGNPPT